MQQKTQGREARKNNSGRGVWPSKKKELVSKLKKAKTSSDSLKTRDYCACFQES